MASTPTTATSSRWPSSPPARPSGIVRIHALLDGRDTPPTSALGYITDLETRLAGVHPGAAIATVGGRYFAMDRDRRWDRVEIAYDAIVHAEATHRAPTAVAAIEAAYARGETDEFVRPTVIDAPASPLLPGDPIVIANFRADRARQLTHALADGPGFEGFDRTSPTGRPAPTDLLVVTMTEYEEGLPVLVAFPPETARSLAQAVSEAGWRQFHVAETEKYAHVTYFFNGGVETPWPGEDRRLIPSQKVATYDLAPEMSAVGRDRRARGGDRFGRRTTSSSPTTRTPTWSATPGVWDATIDALAVIDASLGRVVDAVERAEAADPDGPGAILAITADHGNADDLRDAAGRPVTAHSLNPVPFLLLGRTVRDRQPQATASSPTSRRRSSSSPTCRPGRPSPVARCWRAATRRPRRPPNRPWRPRTVPERRLVVASAAVRTEVPDS